MWCSLELPITQLLLGAGLTTTRRCGGVVFGLKQTRATLPSTHTLSMVGAFSSIFGWLGAAGSGRSYSQRVIRLYVGVAELETFESLASLAVLLMT